MIRILAHAAAQAIPHTLRPAARLAPVLAALLLSALPALAQHTTDAAAAPIAAMVVTAGDIEISGAFSRATLPKAPVAGGYLTLINKGTADDRLVSASSPVAGVAQLHEMKMDGDVMKMGELADGIPVPAGQTVTLAPGGLHIMLMDLKQALVEGSTFPLTLTFEKAGAITIEVLVGGVGASAPAHAMNHSDAPGHEAH